MRYLLNSAAFTAAAVSFAVSNADAREIGAAAAVNAAIDSTQPSTPTRSLLLGDKLIANERLVSSPVGSGQMLFLDQTSLTVSANSDITLDKYIFDPDKDAGEIGLTVARGVMRIVGGRITKSSDATIRTPTATIGIRGGIALVEVAPGGATKVVHIAGEYTRVEANGKTVNITRPNGSVSVDQGGAPQYLGVATPEQIGGFFSAMQGGGGGAQNPVTGNDADRSGIAAVNSEIPGIAFISPISTAGENPVLTDDIEVEQQTLSATPDVAQAGVPAGEATSSNPPTPPVTPPGVNPYVDFIGGSLGVNSTPFTDDAGELVADPFLSNFVFADDEAADATLFEPGSLIITFDDGSLAALPTPASTGFFNVSPGETDTALGELAGAGYADFEAGLFLYGLRSAADDLVAVFGANPGPTQLRNINTSATGFGTTAFEVMPDLAISAAGGTAQPFLPAGLGELFDNGERVRVYTISPTGQPLFTDTAADYSAGARVMIPQFSISGTGESQSYLLHVGATGIANNGDGAPTFSSFGRGSYRFDTSGGATALRPFIAMTQIGEDSRTVFGANDEYILLGNEGAFALSDDEDTEIVASSFNRSDAPESGVYGNLHLAQRAETGVIALADRFDFGATAAAYRGKTGFVSAPDGKRYLSLGFSSNSAALSNSFGVLTDKMVFRSSGISSFGADTGAASFDIDAATGSIVVDLNEGSGSDVFAARLHFGGDRSAVFRSQFFGMQDHNDPSQLANELVFSGDDANFVATGSGQSFGRAPDANGQTAFRGAMVSHEFISDQVASLYPSGTPLSPDYLSWGWWTGNFHFSETDPGVYQDAQLQFSLGTWIGGDQTDILPTSGIATYAGAVTVNNLSTFTGAPFDYVDGGRFDMTFDFTSRTGAAQFTDVLDLAPFSVPVEEIGAIGRNHYGGIAAAGFDVFAVVDGAFFDGAAANDAAATAGSIRLEDSMGAINATGTYWGQR